MASFVAKIISKKILGESLENKFGKEVSFGSPIGHYKTRLLTTHL